MAAWAVHPARGKEAVYERARGGVGVGGRVPTGQQRSWLRAGGSSIRMHLHMQEGRHEEAGGRDNGRACLQPFPLTN